ncbi:MAG: right-handed parallel beta-helix repeat-containing protein [Sedimentisphaerales bacterium]|nr:right-handed parallel beta-helix repeat-containing protein [Sedimentisphaerales bacterium]
MAGKFPIVHICLLLPVLCNISFGADLYVPGSYGTIQGAIDVAMDGDTIIISQGTYPEHINLAGLAITLRSTDPNNPQVVANTVINGSGSGSVILLENSEDTSTVIDGLTITGGNSGFGAGILCVDAGCTVRNCVISSNIVTNRGGGLYCQNGGEIIISGCTFSDNQAAQLGGGIYIINTDIAIDYSTFSNNSSNDYGGGVFVRNTEQATISDCVFNNGNTSTYGGGVCCYESDLALSNTRLNGNEATYGGAVTYYSNSSGSVKHCTITGNISSRGGGIYCNGASSPEIYHCVLAGNLAEGPSDPGGGLHCINSSNPKVLFTTFWQNRPQQIRASTAVPEITWCFVEDGDLQNWHLEDSHNIGDEHGGPWSPPPDDDPIFILEGYWNDNGTPGDTSDDFWTETDFNQTTAYHINIDSPCIDAGDPNWAPQPDYTDIDGELRFSGSATDIGIDETNPDRRVYNKTQGTWHTSIGAAMAPAQAGDELMVTPGRYLETILFPPQIMLSSWRPDNTNFIESTIIDGTYSTGSTIAFTDNTIAEDTTIAGFTITGGTSQAGGGIYCTECRPTISQCVIRDNTADNGGGIACEQASPVITRSIIKDNTTTGSGGGIWINDNSEPDITNCAIDNNNADGMSGGIYCSDTSGFVINYCTIKHNQDYALYYEGSDPQSISNSILWNNHPDDPCDTNQLVCVYPDSVSLYYCDIENDWSGPGEGNIHLNPIFEIDEGDPEDPNDTIEHDYRIVSTSPCINRGDPEDAPGPDQVDMEGNSRLSYCRVDIGACEIDYLAGAYVPGVVNNILQQKWYCSVQEGLDEIANNEVLLIGEGLYQENLVINNNNIILKSTNPSDPDIVRNTIIDGDNTDISDPNYASTITLMPGAALGVSIKGLTIKGGKGFLDGQLTPEDPNDDQAKGGGIYSMANDTISIENCTIIENQADMGGGIYLYGSSNALIKHCIIRDNHCDDPLTGTSGGGLRLNNCSDVDILNCIIADNFALLYGGGLYAMDVNGMTIDFCTLADNHAMLNSGGGLRVFENCPDLSVSNTILWNNTPDQIDCQDPCELLLSYCDIQGNRPDPNAVNIIDADPNFVDPAGDDYHIAPDSPCINRGDPYYQYQAGAVDIDSQIRMAYAYVDIGADEVLEVDDEDLQKLVYNQNKHVWYRTIQAALDEANPNNEIVLMQGTFTENISILHNGIVLRSIDPCDPVIIDNTIINGGAPADPDEASVIKLEADDITLKGLTITGGSGRMDTDSKRKGGGIFSKENDNIKITYCKITDNRADRGGGLYLAQTYGVLESIGSISHCNISGNIAEENGGAMRLYQCLGPDIHHNVFAGNQAIDFSGGGILAETVPEMNLRQCTFHNNKALYAGVGIKTKGYCQGAVITNNIFWNDPDDQPDQIIDESGQVTITYCGGSGLAINHGDPLFISPGIWDDNSTPLDPCDDFWSPGASDYHLPSTYGRWDQVNKLWVLDSVNSPYIDAGDPATDWSCESWPHGMRVNMGAFGCSGQASLSAIGISGNQADINGDRIVNLMDFSALSENWLAQITLKPEDRNRDGHIDILDLLILAETDNWLSQF